MAAGPDGQGPEKELGSLQNSSYNNNSSKYLEDQTGTQGQISKPTDSSSRALVYQECLRLTPKLDLSDLLSSVNSRHPVQVR